MLDFETLLAPVDSEHPSGVLLEYDPAFTALFESAKGRPEQRMGPSVIPAEQPDWGNVEKNAIEILSRTKDLRVATLLVKARLHNAGAIGLFDGIAFVRRLLERHWDTVYPQLDPDDGHDPSMRVNALADLADPDSMLAPFRNAELATARGFGRVCVRDLERSVRGDATAKANGDAAAPEKAPSMDVVLAACKPEALADLATRASAAVEDLRAIEVLVAEKAGPDRVPILTHLTSLLRLVAKFLSERFTVGRSGSEQGAPVPPQGKAPGAATFAGAIRSRNDVVLALDEICTYYERYEPSSPIPLLLKRSRRLVAMTFMDIMRDLVPDAVAHVEALRGKGD